MDSSGGDWEEARAEFFQETYPSDRVSVSGSVGGNGLTSLPSTVGRRPGTEGTGSRSRKLSKMSSAERVSTLESRRSGTTIPIASTTTIDEVVETTSSTTNLHEADYTETRHLVETAIPSRQTSLDENHVRSRIDSRASTSSNLTANRRTTKSRMRAAVQGLEADDSDQDIEVVNFNDGNCFCDM